MNIAISMITAAMTFATAGAARPDLVSSYIQGELGTRTYERADVDLNGDGRKEVFAYVTDRSYCGSSGCTLLVLSPHRNGYRLVLRATATRLPVSVLPTASRGWRDIGVTVSGGGITRPHMARLRYDGRRYPNNPTVLPALPRDLPAGKTLIPD